MKNLFILVLLAALFTTITTQAQDLRFRFGDNKVYSGSDYPNGILEVDNLTIEKGSQTRLYNMTIIVRGDLLTTGKSRLLMPNSRILVTGFSAMDNDSIMKVNYEARVKSIKGLNRKDEDITVYQGTHVVCQGTYAEVADLILVTGVYDVRVAGRTYLYDIVVK